MSTVIVREFGEFAERDAFVLDMQEIEVKDCIGCWNCWLKTPGRCVHSDLDDFYTAFINADRAVFFLGTSRGFVSGNMKSLFDRMIPHFLPYISYDSGESMHLKRYDKYPCVEVYYRDDFDADEERAVYLEYIRRVFYQFHIEYTIHPVSEYMEEAV